MEKRQTFDEQIDFEINLCVGEIADELQNRPPDKISGYKITNPFVSKPMPFYNDIMTNNQQDNEPLNFKSPSEDGFVKKMVEKLSKSNQKDFNPAVPSFKLENHILSDQRKLSSSARKAPGRQKTAPPAIASQEKPKPKTIVPPLQQKFPTPPPSPQQKIISEIVAREITSLTR